MEKLVKKPVITTSIKSIQDCVFFSLKLTICCVSCNENCHPLTSLEQATYFVLFILYCCKLFLSY